MHRRTSRAQVIVTGSILLACVVGWYAGVSATSQVVGVVCAVAVLAVALWLGFVNGH